MGDGSMEDLGFKFNIGDDVVFSATVRAAAARNVGVKPDAFSYVRPQVFNVVGRRLDECYAGVQRHYDLRSVISSRDYVVGVSYAAATSSGLFLATEIELEAAPPQSWTDAGD